ncbi:16S rRNA (uracil(1498)-N(3))-methyltransferase [Actinocrinis puniceicyclus]|uniref:Ribosomal RNA small subunit methyltransferase E n=1 Tax=Actinocrinis puniceicyclus TaxID=977794 RepID=A0A8J8BBD1_9ACTN|nr:16S rRNA (uracil(1498)-N(3))-methyltransferase [Actinocrinis puniceicyclus]MBS2961956.1 16S rRNA (uracil(1498)-N(3))-methyltransferase [Actinocrinis puniceicyclus]
MTTVPVFRVETARLSGAAIRLDGPEGRHAALVRRLRPGERVDLTDGAGRLAECVVRAAGGPGDPALDLEVLEQRSLPGPQPRITVVQALAKGERGELAVELMTELGVDVIVPWPASRSIVQWRAERGEKALAKWRSTAAEAGKQSRRVWWPEVTEPASTARVVELLAGASLAAVLHEDARSSLADLEPTRTGDIVLVVGPEGGISPDELRVFGEAGAAAYRMGPTVLRTSTAGAAAVAVLLARSGRWSAQNQSAQHQSAQHQLTQNQPA